MTDHLIDFNSMPLSDWENLYKRTEDIIEHPSEYSSYYSGRVLGTPFYEPSTRTLFSFQAAVLRLGGSYLGFSDPYNSSVSKGESLKDTIKMVANYTDVIAMRHPLEGAAYAASLYSEVPVINAGDGGHLHPTQTLCDLTTIRRTFGRTDGLSVGFCGDLKNGRTVHSLVKALTRFKNNRFYLISTAELRVPSYIREILSAGGHAFYELDNMDCIGELDVLYMTRIQKERFASEAEYLAQAGIYVLNKKKLCAAKKDMIVLHPLPRVDEITGEVDSDPRAFYFKQARFGMFARMGLLCTLVGQREEHLHEPQSNVDGVSCKNPKCITNHEKYLPARFKRPAENPASLLCEYCDSPAQI